MLLRHAKNRIGPAKKYPQKPHNIRHRFSAHFVTSSTFRRRGVSTPDAHHLPHACHDRSGKLTCVRQAALNAYRLSRVILAPLREASAIRPVLVSTRATTCEEIDFVSIVPF